MAGVQMQATHRTRMSSGCAMQRTPCTGARSLSTTGVCHTSGTACPDAATYCMCSTHVCRHTFPLALQPQQKGPLSASASMSIPAMCCFRAMIFNPWQI